MKPGLVPPFVATFIVVLLGFFSASAQEKPKPADELKALVAKVNAKAQGDKKTEADFATELKEFDELLAEHKDEKTDEVAQIALMKAVMYSQLLDNPEKSIELVRQLKRDFPDTQPGKRADEMLENLKKEIGAKKIKSALVEGAKFPDFEEKDLAGKPLSVGNYKGSVVLVDFWATWCYPCVADLPNVMKAYEKNHAKGFEIIGISLDQDEKRLKNFTKERNMTWPQYFDGKVWTNKLAGKYGVHSIPTSYLLDREGKIIGKDLSGKALDEAVTAALGKK